jgi:hypothetical protein
VAILALAGYQVFRPHIATASVRELEEVCPADLVRPIAIDVQGQARYKRVLELAKRFIDNESGPRRRSVPDAKNLGLLEQELAAVLGSGTLQRPIDRGDDFDTELHPLATFATAIGADAWAALKAGQARRCVNLLALGQQLAGRVKNARGTQIAYIVMSSLDTIASNAIVRCMRTGKLSQSDLRELIAAIPPGQSSDEVLFDDWAIDFQTNILPMLGHFQEVRKELAMIYQEEYNPRAAVVGSYDAKDTAEILGAVYHVGQENATRGWRAQDQSDVQIVTRQKGRLPYDGNRPDGNGLSQVVYELEMNAIPNSIGSQLIAVGLGVSSIRRTSLVTETRHDIVRTLLALAIYRMRHGGSPAPDLAALVSDGELPKAPTDWFSLGPLRYIVQRGLVYTVGPEDVDEGPRILRDGWTPHHNFGMFLDEPKNH